MATTDLFSTIQLNMESNFENGDILNNRFRIIKQTRGGSGMIYYCEEIYDHIPCLLKAHKIQFAKCNTEKDAEIFLKEARALIKLPPHENVIHFMYMQVIQGIYFIVMEWCAHPLRRMLDTGEIFAPTAILRIAVAVCRGMQHCQKYLSEPGKQFVHGDLKPDNLYITSDGQVRIGDFGGGYTTGYASPEQLEGGQIDGRSDIYSLGIIMQELLAQELAGAAIEMERLQDISRIAEICSDKNPENRYQSFAELEEELSDVYESITGFPPPAVKPVETERYKMECKRACDYAMTGEPEKAYSILTALVEDPDVPDNELAATYDNLGILLHSQHYYEEALYWFKQAADLECEERIRGLEGMALTYCALEDWDNVLECAMRAVQIDGYDMEAVSYMVQALHRSGRTELLDELIPILGEIYKKYPENREPLRESGYICYLQKKFEKAAAYYKEYLSLSNGSWKSVFYYAVSLYMINDLTAAANNFRKVLRLSRDEGNTDENKYKLIALAYSNYYLRDYIQTGECVEQYVDCVGRAEDMQSIEFLLEYDQELCEKYYNIIVTLNEECTRADNEYVIRPEGYYIDLVSRCTMLREDVNEVAVIEVSPFRKYINVATYSHECVIWMMTGHCNNALKACEHALEWDASSPSNLFNKGELLLRKEQYKEALECYEKALEYQDMVERRIDIKKRLEEVKKILQLEDTEENHMSFFTFRDKYKELLERLEMSVDRLSSEIFQNESNTLGDYIVLEMIPKIKDEINNQRDYLDTAQSIPYEIAMHRIIDEGYLISKMCISVQIRTEYIQESNSIKELIEEHFHLIQLIVRDEDHWKQKEFCYQKAEGQIPLLLLWEKESELFLEIIKKAWKLYDRNRQRDIKRF